MSEHVHFDLEDATEADLPSQFVRWVQPPQIAYFISSVDKEGNQNVAAVTMGTTMYIDGDSIAECAINLEMKIVSIQELSKTTGCSWVRLWPSA